MVEAEGGDGDGEEGNQSGLIARRSPMVAHILRLRDADLGSVLPRVGEVVAGGLDTEC